MKKLILFFILMTFTIMSYSQAKIPPSLRQGIQVDEKTISIALEMQKQGWVYVMPQPKSPQASWGNKDGRTTWFDGYWINGNKTSSTMPILKDGKYVGDDAGIPGWSAEIRPDGCHQPAG